MNNDDRAPRRPDPASLSREVDCLVAMGRLAGKVAHEINNPLAGIQNAFMLVKDAIPVTHPHYSYVGSIEREIRRMAMVTRQLAEQYRPEQDRAVGLAVPVIVEDAIRMSLYLTGSASDSVRLDLQYHDVFCAPAGVLRHALQYLVEDALRAATGGSVVEVDVAGQDGMLTIRVQYSGGSMAADGWSSARRMIEATGGTLREVPDVIGTTVMTMVVPLFHEDKDGP